MKLSIAIAVLMLGASGCHDKVVHRGDFPVTVRDGDRVLAHCQKYDDGKVAVSGCQIEKGATLDQVLTAIMQQIYEPATPPQKVDAGSKI